MTKSFALTITKSMNQGYSNGVYGFTCPMCEGCSHTNLDRNWLETEILSHMIMIHRVVVDIQFAYVVVGEKIIP